ncbi:MAG: DUF308 domain-containing protein [Acidobacteriaceae bacterium]
MGTAAAAPVHPTGWSITISILLIILGLLAIAAPFFAGLAVTVLLGWLIIIAGFGHLIYAWSERGAGAILWQVLIAAVYLFGGFYVLLHPVGGVVALTLVLVFYIAAEGVFELGAFFALRHLSGAAWYLVDGIVSLVLAALIFFHWPSSSVWAIGTLVGISILFSGFARLTMPMSRRRVLLPV